MSEHRRAILRKAADHTIRTAHQPGQSHRSSGGGLIDYDLQAVTGNAARAIATMPNHFADKPSFASPWHMHDCELQVAVVLEGSIELGYVADTYARAVKGDVLFIPGQVAHDVGAPSADYQVVEVTFPGTFGTIECAMPVVDATSMATTLSPQHAVREGTTNGITHYRYALDSRFRQRFALFRCARSRTEPFAPAVRTHRDICRFTVVSAGSVGVDLGDGPERAAIGDILIVPHGAHWRECDVSADYAAIEVRVLAA